jgi:hypothetical protein
MTPQLVSPSALKRDRFHSLPKKQAPKKANPEKSTPEKANPERPNPERPNPQKSNPPNPAKARFTPQQEA